jgi:hypothetical protein
MGSSLSGIDGRLIAATAALMAVALGGSSASANLRAPRSEVANPSSAIRPSDPASHVRVSHEDLSFQCHGRSCQVAATYTIDADAALATELIFVLPVETGVTAVVGGTAVPTVVKRLRALPSDFEQHLDLRREYMLPDAAALPPLYQASVRVSFVPGRNQVSFSYEQPLGAVESDHSYFHDGTMEPRLLYVLWPLREWKRAPGFAMALRIAMDRELPGWWKRTFGHPATVVCEGLKGQQAQVGRQLVYTAALSEDFSDYLRCWVGP